ncbi:MAG TPA: alpha/beta fold hydrolase [Candidatus Eisenbacteria bacterium]|nr:alpha/beta fold hydrolase [Candidatus Eisenbacteria bacterium]
MRTFWNLVRRALLGALALLALAVIAGAVWQAAATRRDRARFPVSGERVDAGGFRLHLVPAGLGRPGPTVLLECGIGGATAVTWSWVERGVAPFAPVVAYDRAGMGLSDPGPSPRDGIRMARELHAALEHAGLPGPYVFVGHSYGGLIARIFTSAYPRDVAGLVLVESSHPAQFGPGGGGGGRMLRRLRAIGALLPLAPWLARIGVMRAVMDWVPTDADLLPAPARDAQRAFMSSSRQWVAIVDELRCWADCTNPEARAAGGFGNRPLAVVTAGEHAGWGGGWMRLQAETAALSTRHEQLVVPGATHGSVIADSSHAVRVVGAIRDVVNACRGAAFPPAAAR